MTKEEAIEQLNFMGDNIPKEPPTECDYIEEWLDTNKDIRNTLDMAIKALEQEPRWIPVSEESPKEIGCYMTTIDYGEYGLSVGPRFYYGKDHGWTDRHVIAWMPLPEPYKPQESENIDSGCSDAEIAKSFIEDVETVKDLLPQEESEGKYVIHQTYSPVDFCEYGKCPTCGETVSGFSIGSPNLYDEECPKCGQKLKWR